MPTRFEDAARAYPELIIGEDRVGFALQLSCFKEDDDGVPPPCRPKHCPLSQNHPWLNGPWVRKYIGSVGLSHCDRFRKLWLGLASWISIIALGMTIYGCTSLSTNDSVVRRTYWAAVDGQSGNFSHGAESGFSMYVGLTTFIYSDCAFVPGTESYPHRCHQTSVSYSSATCSQGPLSGACKACSSVATSIWFAAVTNVFGLVLATNGAQIRMRRVADVPVQKILGMVLDLMGAVTLAGSLLDFHTQCFYNLQSALASSSASARVWSGPGFVCYTVCAFAALVRAAVHWATPIPQLSLSAAVAKAEAEAAKDEELEMRASWGGAGAGAGAGAGGGGVGQQKPASVACAAEMHDVKVLPSA